ncbi:hypothetical protein COM96_12370 [Bacillus cereus]|uniref:CDP-diacylglycerol--serine O-phosphatidyltransferase n=2 Tax=Bacillus cereus TaxID=1396 RepID=A0A2A7HXR9_BACCE|nr:hypothetical protein COM96_12370 [Bacillus cereus]
MSYIPNMITIANFVRGLLAIYAVFVHDIYLGAVFIITGMLFDFFDGMVARKLDSVSEIGGELDSFAAMCLLILCFLNNPVSVAFGTCILAYLMVSKIKFPHFKKDISESLKPERWD